MEGGGGEGVNEGAAKGVGGDGFLAPGRVGEGVWRGWKMFERVGSREGS